jgi:hypothetical protein
MSKKQLQTKSWKDLMKFKKVKDIVCDDKVLFTMEELNNEDFTVFFNMMFDNIKNNTNENNILSFDLLNSKEVIVFLLKKMVKGEYGNFENLTDEEIVNVAENTSSEISEQINDVIEELIMKRFYKRIDYLTKLTNTLKENELVVNETEEKQG